MSSKLSIVIIFLLCLACNKNTLSDYSKRETFVDLHQSIARYTASIDARNINWDSIVQIYDPLISDELSEEAFFDLMGEMLRTFRDPHIWLIAPKKEMYTIDFLGYEYNFDDSLLINQYVDDLEVHTPSIKSGFINDRFGYLVCKDFKGDEVINNEIYKSVIEKFGSTDGLIIDLRFNDGGSVYNAQNLLNKLSSRKTLWHTTQNRTVNGFDRKYEWYIEPDPLINYAKNIVVLTGRYTISAGERFAMGSQALDHITIVGDTTANTQGSVMGREMLNGWKYTLTFEKCFNSDGVNYAGVGIPPDYFIPFQPMNIDDQDLIIEKALELLDN